MGEKRAFEWQKCNEKKEKKTHTQTMSEMKTVFGYTNKAECAFSDGTDKNKAFLAEL